MLPRACGNTQSPDQHQAKQDDGVGQHHVGHSPSGQQPTRKITRKEDRELRREIETALVV